ncbi:MAG: transposase [Cyanobacteria bacterium J06600_6]
MLHLPAEFRRLISSFSHSFTSSTWLHTQLLLVGAVLCPGKRTVCNLLRSVGLSELKQFHKYHRVLSRAKWSARQLAHSLLLLLIHHLGPGSDQPLVFGIDETIERRWGRRISKRGIYRDPVRSSKSFFVKCSGLRWMSLMFLAELPWGQGICWALPFLSALCPSERYYTTRNHQPKKLTDWARQLIIQLGRWTREVPNKVYLTADNTYATYDLLNLAPTHGVEMIVRMRLDARLFYFPKAQPASKRGRKPKVGKRQLTLDKRVKDKRIKWTRGYFDNWYGRKKKQMEFCSHTALWYKSGHTPVPLRWVLIRDPQGKLDPVVIGCTDSQLPAQTIVEFFLRGWRVEVTFAEVRRHLGVETQRQWSDMAIERSTPALLALFSIVTLWANCLHRKGKLIINKTAWYPKDHLTFSDAIAAVRRHIYEQNHFLTSTKNNQVKFFKTRPIDIWKIIVSNVA